MVMQPTHASCVTRNILNIGPLNGVSVNTCATPNVLATSPLGSTVDTFNVRNNLNITIEIWFSMKTAVPVDEVFNHFLLEISSRTTFLPTGQNSTVSLSPADTQVFFSMGRLVLPDENLYVSPAFGIAALLNEGGFCERLDANTIFTSDESAGFKPLLETIPSTVDRMYKMMVTVGNIATGVSTIYISTADDPSVVEYAVPFPVLLLYGVSPLRLQINPLSVLRLGCTVQNEPAFPGVFYRVAVYDKALTIDEARAAFDSI
jgi:hypothetical protein